MRTNRLRAGVERGEVQIGTWMTMARNPAILALFKAAGLDFVRIDMEHASPSMETVADMAMLARALDFPIVVRPPVANREWITRLLAAGIWNFHCPQVETVEQAEEIVSASRYAPAGLRGNLEFGVATDFEPVGASRDWRNHVSREVFITVMLETSKAFDHLDAIAAMPGIDALTLGPADLAQDLGILDSPDRDRILDEKRQLVLAAAKRHGKTCAMMASNAAQVQQWSEAGALLLAYSSDAEMLYSGFRNVIDRLKA